jgi:hypothetical protein
MLIADSTPSHAPVSSSLAVENIPRKSIRTEISPLRFAPVEMTKGRAVLPERIVAEQKPIFIPLGGLA